MAKIEFISEAAAKKYLLKQLSVYSDFVLEEYRDALVDGSDTKKTILYAGLEDILPSISDVSGNSRGLQLDAINYVMSHRREWEESYQLNSAEEEKAVINAMLGELMELMGYR